MDNSKQQRVLIAGGTGLIGKALSRELNNLGFEVSILSRRPHSVKKFKAYSWNPDNEEIDPESILNQNFIINLAGESIADKYWTKKRRKVLLESRVIPLQLIEKALQQANHKPTKILSASAIGYYGHRPKTVVDEDSDSGLGFLSSICRKWEKAANKISPNTIKLRIGIVLSQDGGYLPKILQLLKARINVVFGNGKQITSWIHINDLVSAIVHILKSDNSKSVYNLTAPNPISAYDLQKLVAQKNNLRTLDLFLPQFPVKKLLGSFSEIFLNELNVKPTNLLNEGFNFKHNHIEEAI